MRTTDRHPDMDKTLIDPDLGKIQIDPDPDKILIDPDHDRSTGGIITGIDMEEVKLNIFPFA